jgi:hypothetical protein
MADSSAGRSLLIATLLEQSQHIEANRFYAILDFGRTDVAQTFLQTFVSGLTRWIGIAALPYLAIPVCLRGHVLLRRTCA